MATLGEYLGAGSATTKLLLHLNGNFTDSSGNGNNSNNNNMSSANGKFGGGYFSSGGSTIRNIATPSSASLISPTNAITVSIWVNPATIVNQTVFLTMRILPDPTPPYNAFIIGNDNSPDNYYCGIQTSNNFYNTTSNVTVPTNTWSNLLFTYDGSKLKLYFNGNFVNETNATGNISYGSNRELRSTSNSTNLGQYYTGAVDETIIENRAWSAEEVKKYYTNSLGRFATL